MTIMMTVILISVLYLLLSTCIMTLIAQKVHYKDIDKRPADKSLIAKLTDNSALGLCLLECSRNKDCKAVVYEEGHSCYLYSTSVGSVPLIAGQKAIAESKTESGIGNVVHCSVFLYIYFQFSKTHDNHCCLWQWPS